MTRSLAKLALMLLVAAIIAVGGMIVWRIVPRAVTSYVGVGGIDEPAADARLRDILWEPPVALDAINTDDDEYEACYSPDGEQLLFVRGRPGENGDIYATARTADGWSDPVALDAINSEDDDLGPELSADGQTLYFYSNRPGGRGGYDLWSATRGADGGWRTPMNLGPAVNSRYNEYGPAAAPDGGALYFASNRPREPETSPAEDGAWAATLREDLFGRPYDLYVSALGDAGLAEASLLKTLNSPASEGSPAVSPAGDFVYFSSDRAGGTGGFDLYRARRMEDGFGDVESLGSTINTAANELDPTLTLEGFGLHYSSNHRRDGAAPDAPPHYDLHATVSREVYAKTEYVTAGIDWAGLWTALWPNLIWLLVLLLLLALLLLALREGRRHRFNLLTKCLLASLIAHLVLLLVTTLVEVGSSIGTLLQGGQPTRVALMAPREADGLAAQVRGELTDVRVEPVHTESERRELEPTMEVEPIQLARLESVRLESDAALEPPAPTEVRDAAAPAPMQESPDDRVEDAQSVEVTLPADQARQNAAEAALDAALTASAPSDAPRQEMPPPADTRVVTVAMPVERITIDTPPPLVDAADAASDARDAPASEATATTAEVPTDLPVKVAPLPEATRAPATEQVMPVRAAPSTLAPADLPETGSGTSAETTLRDIAPAPSAPILPDAPVFDARAVADAAPLATDVAVEAALAPADPAPTMVTPALEEATAPSTSVEQATAIAARRDALGRAEVPPDDASPPAPAAVAMEMAPLAVDAALDTMTPAVTTDAQPMAPMPIDVASLAAPELLEVAVDRFPATATGPTPVAETTEASSAPQASDHPVARAMALAEEAPATAEVVLPAAPLAVEAPEIEVVALPAVPLEPMAMATSPDPTPVALPDLDFDVRVPTEVQTPSDAYEQRSEAARQRLVEEGGGSDETEEAVARALEWLARHQSNSGRWDSRHFDRGCGECGNPATVEADMALTGLALLCFLGADHTHMGNGPYRDVVARAITWLVEHQDADGDLRGDETMYSHGIATIALSEAYGMTGDAALADPVRRAIDFITRARNRRDGGWRYEPRQYGDTSVLGWQVMALVSAKRAGLDVPDAALDSARRWLDGVEFQGRKGVYVYQPGQRPSYAMTAEAMFSQQLLGLDREDPRMQGSARFIVDNLPDWRRDANTYYWYYATLALYQHGGEAWEAWNERLTNELLDRQHTTGKRAGSWDPSDKWGRIGGRIYQTAMCTLSLEVYYRYLPLYRRR